MTPKFEDAISVIVKAWEGRKDAPDYPDYDDINTAIGSLEEAVKILGILKPRMNFGEDTEEGEKVIWFFTIYEGEHGYDDLKEWLEEAHEDEAEEQYEYDRDADDVRGLYD